MVVLILLLTPENFSYSADEYLRVIVIKQNLWFPSINNQSLAWKKKKSKITHLKPWFCFCRRFLWQQQLLGQPASEPFGGSARVRHQQRGKSSPLQLNVLRSPRSAEHLGWTREENHGKLFQRGRIWNRLVSEPEEPLARFITFILAKGSWLRS